MWAATPVVKKALGTRLAERACAEASKAERKGTRVSGPAAKVKKGWKRKLSQTVLQGASVPGKPASGGNMEPGKFVYAGTGRLLMASTKCASEAVTNPDEG